MFKKPQLTLRERRANVPPLATTQEVLHNYQFETRISAWWKLRQLKKARSVPTEKAKKAYPQILLELEKLNIAMPLKKKYGLFSFLMNSGEPQIVLPLKDKTTKQERAIEITTHTTEKKIIFSVKELNRT